MRALLVAAAVIATTACTTTGSPDCDPALHDALTAWEQTGFSGAVAFDGPLATCVAGYGLADRQTGQAITRDTVFAIGSVTKAFTAAAVLDLAAAGDLDLDDPAGRWLADLDPPLADVTIRQLLGHTAGIAGEAGREGQPLTSDQAVDATNRLDLAFPPGTDSLYSNTGYTLLAMIVEEVAGRPYRDHLRQGIAPAAGWWDGEPAAPEPRARGYLPGGEPGHPGGFAGPHWALEGAGGLAMTAPALATWTRALFAGDVLPPSATQLLETPLFDFGDGTAEHPGWVGLQPDGPLGTPAYVVSGGGGSVGHDAIAAWLPDHDQVVVIATNGPDVIAENLFRTLVPALLAGDPPPHPAATTQTDPAALENLAGTYQLGPDDRFEVVPDQGLLRIEAHGPRALATLFPLDGLADPAEAAAHEARVAAFVAGDTEAGRQELDLLRQDFGDVQAARIVGTAYLDIELRTYVTFDFAGRPGVLAWYALDEAGTIAGADVNAEPPSLLLGATDTGTFVPAGAGASPEVEVAFDGDTMTVTSPDGATEARR